MNWRTQLFIVPQIKVCENFILHSHLWSKFQKLMVGLKDCGFVTTNFCPTKSFNAPEMNWTDGANRMKNMRNGGGSSETSEVFSFELFSRCFNAELIKTEMEVPYSTKRGPIIDYVCEMFNTTVGVSVTRAMKYKGDYSLKEAKRLLNKKLEGFIKASKKSQLKWDKRILHIWSTSQHITNIVEQAYTSLDPEIKSNTVVFVTTATHADYIFSTKKIIH
jgi:hypothetical protein